MKTLNLTLALIFVLGTVTAGAQQNADATEAATQVAQEGLISLEAVNEDGSVVRGVNTPRFDDSLLTRACCVQPEVGGFQNPLITAIESLASLHVIKAVVGGHIVDVCNKVAFLSALNSKSEFQELRRQHKNGVVLQVRKSDIKSSAALACLSK